MIKDKSNSKPTIDLTGPDGNAFALIGYARKFAKQLDFTKEQIETIIAEMMSGDYENLISVFDKNFGEYVDLER